MQNHNALKSIHACFKWYEKEVTGLFFPAKSVVQYFISVLVGSTDFLHKVICYTMAYHLLYLYESLFFIVYFCRILYTDYLKNSYNYDFQIFTVSLPFLGIEVLTYSARSLIHDVIQAPFCEFTLSFISS